MTQERRIKKVLIANRSEIACRIIRACKELEILTVAIYSEVDANALFVLQADEAVNIGPAAARESYLNIDKILQIAKDKQCDAIHPGYGFLSENEEFNRRVREQGLIFIGPKEKEMELLGSKIESRRLMLKNHIPVVPGFEVITLEIEDIKEKVEKIGYPVIVKASAGGGGKGMRVVHSFIDLQEAILSAKREALSAFGDDSIFIEKYIQNPRHIEVQIAADSFGNYIHLFERECSLQRRHQKVVEETPSTALLPELREKITSTAIDVVKSVNYQSVGTVEFIMDNEGNFYFLEVNTRIQVEHPITEMVTGIDLVKLQILIAEGLALPYKQEDIKQLGHSIECRVYAEDANNNFMPTGGEILFLKEPSGNGVRVDSGISRGSVISSYYDPIMSKIIVHAENREFARKKMIEALKSTVLLGVKTSIPFMINLLNSEQFISGNTFTNTIGDNLSDITNRTSGKNIVDSERTLELLLATVALTRQNRKSYSNSPTHKSISQESVWIQIGGISFL